MIEEKRLDDETVKDVFGGWSNETNLDFEAFQNFNCTDCDSGKRGSCSLGCANGRQVAFCEVGRKPDGVCPHKNALKMPHRKLV